MKILFICGCLAPGKDGVGDYVRRLAITIVKQGVDVSAVALYDFFIDSISEEFQSYEKNSLSILRIPNGLQLSKRIEYAKTSVDKFDPDWISLQFVPYSFHYKGLPFNLVSLLKKIGPNRNWHFMFHELWIGMEVNAKKSHYLIGILQQFLIGHLIRRIKPLRMHTQTKLYQVQLNKIGYKAHYLPLFSNIPNFFAKDRKKNSQVKKERSEILLVMFGNIHYNAPLEQFADEAAAVSRLLNRRIHLKIIGRCGERQQLWKSVWESKGLSVEVMGQQSAKNISKVFSTASAGITTTPIVLAEKSGSVATMRLHSLPIICVSSKWKPRGVLSIEPSLDIAEYQSGNLNDCLKNLNNTYTKQNSVASVSHQLIANLSELTYYGDLQLSMD